MTESPKSPTQSETPPEPSASLRAEAASPQAPESSPRIVHRPNPKLVTGQSATAAPQTQLSLPGILEGAQHWTGSFPPPEAAERYERVLRGSFARMITMAEELQAQQISQAYFVLRNTQQDNRRGQWLGFLTTILAMVCALGSLFLDYPWVGLAFASIPVMAVAKALVESVKTPTPTELKATTKAGAQPRVPAKPKAQARPRSDGRV
jgi:uncharacterized membrane protein